jgi:amino acid adenylation domain-containing protein
VHWQLPELEILSLDLEIQSTHFDLEMHLWEETDGSLGVACVYDRDLFDHTTIGRMVARYGCLLEEICAAPKKSLREFPWLTAAERHQALVEWGEGAVQGPVCRVQHGQSAPCIVEAFLRRAQEAPAAIALVYSAPGESKTSHQVLSYGTLHRQARCLSHRLRALGVGPQVVVAVLTGRTAEMIIAYLAVLETGGAYLPLDPDTPVERLQWMLHDSTAKVLLTSSSLADRIVIGAGSSENSGIHRIVVGRALEGVASGPPSAGLLRHASPLRQASLLRNDDLAYVIYTSGSTGRPKGVMVSHGGLRNLVSWHLQQYQVCPEDRTTLLAAVIFDASVWEIWPVLAAGACLHIPPSERRLATADLAMWMVEQGITASFLPTPLAQELVASPPLAGLKLRLLLTGGDVLHPLPQPVPFALINHYGPTENSVVATSARVFSGGATEPPIGRPIAGVRAVVLDGDSQPAAVGVAGELWLGGRGLARGYLNLPGRTAESFVPDPLPNGVGHHGARDEGAAGGRFYRTGDQVRFLADGRLEFLGRFDHQVKVRGMRMELGEIEGVLGDSSAVREAAVVLVKSEGVSRLVGWVVAVAADPPGEDFVPRLLATLRRSLPQAMVPSNLVVLEALPRTASGKVDRRLLALKAADMAADRPQLATSFEPPRGDLQQKIAEVWQEEIALERIGIHDNFFEVGGHSLAMVKIRERLREIVEQELSLVEMFQYPTIHLLARYLSEGMPHSRAGEGGGVDSSRARAERQGEKRHTARARLGSRLARRRRAPKGPRK